MKRNITRDSLEKSIRLAAAGAPARPPTKALPSIVIGLVFD